MLSRQGGGMRVKNKIMASFLAVFLLNLVILAIYYNFVLSNDVTATIDNAQEKLDTKAGYYAGLIKGYGGDSLTDFLGGYPELKQYNMIVTDVESDSVIYGQESKEPKVTFYGTALSEYRGRKVFIKVYRHYDIRGIRTFSLVKRLLYAEGIILAVLIVLMGFIFHYIYVKPLMEINRKMAAYRKHKNTDLGTTDRKDELGQIEREFHCMVNTIEEEKRMQNHIIASISHDVKTPLTSVMGYVERLKSGKVTDPEKTGRYLQTIYNRAQDIRDIISDFDEYLSSNTDNSPLHVKTVTTGYICNLLKDEYTEELALKSVEFSVENHCRNSNINTDLSKLRRVFRNVIGNALRYVPSESAKIRVLCEKKEDKIQFVISDNGPGVPREELDKIFEAFYTRDSSRGSGSGLGLSICKRIIEAHGGTVFAENSALGGLDIILYLLEV